MLQAVLDDECPLAVWETVCRRRDRRARAPLAPGLAEVTNTHRGGSSYSLGLTESAAQWRAGSICYLDMQENAAPCRLSSTCTPALAESARHPLCAAACGSTAPAVKATSASSATVALLGGAQVAARAVYRAQVLVGAWLPNGLTDDRAEWSLLLPQRGAPVQRPGMAGPAAELAVVAGLRASVKRTFLDVEPVFSAPTPLRPRARSLDFRVH